MSDWWWFVIGLAAGGPVWIAIAWWLSRRTWRTARRLSAKARGLEHLVELGQLAGGLAHEIKNPLSTINLNLKLLSEDLLRHEDDDHRRWLRRLKSVQGETDRLKGILDDFLRFAGKYELGLAVIDMRSLIGELTDFFGPQASAAHVVLRTSMPEKEVPCRVDANLIKQALLNLMINAVHAMPQGGELLVRLSSARNQALIEVIDTGAGIGKGEIARIFQVYYSTKGRGMGLGLPTTKRIVHEHDGAIRVESEVGKGTRFVISLPMAKP
jgi:signal transduction histidine kinase